jgi:hypothetical protein
MQRGIWRTLAKRFFIHQTLKILLLDVQEHFGKWSLYRFHIEDPIHFQKSIRVTIEHGPANDLANEYSSVGYWYQLEPHKKLPELPPLEKRLPRRWPEHGLWER